MLLLGFIVGGLLSGCTVPEGGVVGIGVGADGAVHAYVLVCEGGIDGLTLYHTTAANWQGKEIKDGEWVAPARLTRVTAVSLTAPLDGWTVEHALDSLDPKTEYALYGWTKDNKWSTDHLNFVVSDLDDLQAGDVLFPDTQAKSGHQIVAAAAFNSALCGELGY